MDNVKLTILVSSLLTVIAAISQAVTISAKVILIVTVKPNVVTANVLINALCLFKV